MVVESHDDFPGVEIAIAGGVGEMVRALTTVTFSFFFLFSFFSFFFFFKSYVHCFYGTRNDMYLSRYGQNKA